VTKKSKAYELDLILKFKRGPLYLYGTYGYAVNERTQDDDIAELTYNPVWDRRHNVNLVANYKIGDLVIAETGEYLDSKWELSARFNLGTGFPFTQTLAFYPGVDLLSDDFNNGRLPDYHRLDLSAKRRFALGNRVLLEVNASAINVYNRANIFYYDRVRNERVDQLPFLPTLGAKLTW